MGYVICEKCGGYYEIQEGESFTDFDACQCGGRLTYVDSINENIEDEQKVLYCLNCGNYDNEGVYCSKCGGKLIFIKNGNVINNVRPSNEIELVKQVLSAETDDNLQNKPKSLFERISWTGILAGVGFLLISIILIGTIIKKTLSNGGDMNIIGTALTAIVISFVILIISGFLAAYISKSRDYVDGAINGFIIGLIYFILGVIMSDVHSEDILFIILPLFGGITGIFMRNELDRTRLI